MTFVDSWDDRGTWDSGLQWDVNQGTPIGDPTPYLNLVTSEHRKPKFLAYLQMFVQPLVDIIALNKAMETLFDLDTSIGDQLDIVGQWVGVSRDLKTQITGVYFSLGGPNLGLGQGVMQGPFDPSSGLTTLPDDQYRLLLRAKIANNQWDGTISGAYDVLSLVFAGTANTVLIFDEGSMHMALGLLGPTPNSLLLAMFAGGYISVKPAGVHVDAYYTPSSSAPSAPYFGLGAENAAISGLGVGSFGVPN